MVDATPTPPPDAPPLTTSEIAQRYGRALNTVQKHWVTHQDWPAPVGKRGRWKVYDAAAVDAVVRALFVPEASEPTGNPDELLTRAEVAAYRGIAESTLRSYITRGQFIEPDDTTGGVDRWRRSTLDAHPPTRRRRATRADR
ncbi:MULTISPECIES: AlpA family transcriptional regulator [unclassified Nocardia]|uniref:helix-turn-helix transcriptional regulator n=1 Tax=unclassified Nocardia TaxID=2637762 RepID=UPI00278C3F4D|nr:MULTISPECIES: hypothetical protein [unclassified Nocardia]